MATPPMMQCGCRANATDEHNEPVCAVHIGLDAGATLVDDHPPDLSHRMAACVFCKKEARSDGQGRGYSSLAFFESRPTAPFDGYYCGCRGWD